MSDNKFIKHLRGEDTTKSVLEIKNQRTTTSFANMPDGDTSNANDVHSDHRGNATGVLKGTENWKLDGQNLVETTTVCGDGRDLTNSFGVFGNSLWIDATCTFVTARRFSPNTKFVLKLCGHDLETVVGNTIDFTLIVKFGTSNLISKMFSVTEQAFNFCKEFVIDFAESNSETIKLDAGSTMQVQLLCADPAAQAVIYNGMTVFTALQRRVDADAVASDTKTFAEVVQDIDDINDEIVQIHEDIDDLQDYVDDTFVKKAGDTMSGALNIENIASSNAPLLTLTHSNTATYKWNIASWYNSTTLSIYPGSTETNGYRFTSTGFVPSSNDARYLGSASLKWKGVYTTMLNNGGDLVVPAVSGIIATKADVDLAANSGRMITDQGVWYAKMYSATVAPSAENGTNYADFSQVDGQGNPIIVIYERQNGAWVQSETIIPPAEYDGYVPITSKIWDIAEQAGQQGGRILWNHQSKEFTPYPQIVSFEDIEITGNSTVVMPQTPGTYQIVNKYYVDYAISNAIGNGTITITQGGTTKGTFTTNQGGNTTIDLDSGGAGHNVGDVFFTMRNDNELNGAVECDGATYNTTDFIGAQSIGALLAAGKVPYVSLADYATALATNGSVGAFGWDGGSTTAFRVPLLNDIFIETGTATQIGDYLKPGLPDHTHTVSTYDRVYTFAGGTYGGLTAYKTRVTSAASESNPIYGNSTTVQPNAVRYRAMVQLATSTTDQALETCTGVLADVAALKYDYVVDFQAPTAENNYTWYRKYKSGWVEQGGGSIDISYQTAINITLPITMANTNYTIMVSQCTVSSSYAEATLLGGTPVSTTQIRVTSRASSTSYDNTKFYWIIKGMAA